MSKLISPLPVLVWLQRQGIVSCFEVLVVVITSINTSVPAVLICFRTDFAEGEDFYCIFFLSWILPLWTLCKILWPRTKDKSFAGDLSYLTENCSTSRSIQGCSCARSEVMFTLASAGQQELLLRKEPGRQQEGWHVPKVALISDNTKYPIQSFPKKKYLQKIATRSSFTWVTLSFWGGRRILKVSRKLF